MDRELIICIPGTWEDRSSLVREVVTSTQGNFMFAGGILAHPAGKDHVEVTFDGFTPAIEGSFRVAGQGRIPDETLQELREHRSVVYLHFPLRYLSQRERINKFTSVLKNCGGIAIKLESTGIAHTWERWSELVNSENLFDAYCTCVILVSDDDVFYSCGMHNFGLPEAQAPSQLGLDIAAQTINNFNLFQLCDEPKLAEGHTFSLSDDSPRFRITSTSDHRNDPDDLFHNENGLWSLTQISSTAH